MQNENDGGGRPLRVCYFGTYRAGFTRNQILLAGLRTRRDVQVYECHSKLWRGIEDRVEQASGGWRKPAFWARALKSYWRLFRRHNQTPDYDVMLVGYPGQIDTFLARLLTWWRRKPLALEVHMSLYLVAEERGLTAASPRTARLIHFLEGTGLRLPDLLFSENSAYEAYYCRRYDLEPRKFAQVPHGADDRVFFPRDVTPPAGPFRVTYHGSFLPSHGMDAIIGAAILLRDDPGIQFHFYGHGPETERIQQIAAAAELDNVRFHGFVSRQELLDAIAAAHISLGVFGMTKQSHYTIQNKVWEALAMARPLISGDSAVVRQALVHEQHIYLVPRDDPRALAAAIERLKADPQLREHIARAGHEQFLAANSIAAIGAITEEALRSLV